MNRDDIKAGVFLSMSGTWQEQHNVKTLLDWTDFGYATVVKVSGIMVYLKTVNNKDVLMHVEEVEKYWELHPVTDFRGTVLNIGDKCAVADSGKDIFVGTIQKFGKWIHKGCGWCEVQVTFGDIECTTYEWKKNANTRTHSDHKGRIKL